VLEAGVDVVAAAVVAGLVAVTVVGAGVAGVEDLATVTVVGIVAVVGPGRRRQRSYLRWSAARKSYWCWRSWCRRWWLPCPCRF